MAENLGKFPMIDLKSFFVMNARMFLKQDLYSKNLQSLIICNRFARCAKYVTLSAAFVATFFSTFNF